MKKIIFILVLMIWGGVFGQSYLFKIKGKVIAKFDNQALQSATIHLENVKDKSIVSYTISDNKGLFDLSGKSFYKNLRLVVSFMGMKSYQKLIPSDKLNNYDIGTIILEDEQNMLGEVTVVSRAPITIKKDTLEFNVSSFKTKKDASVEELLEKLPGVEVDEKGNITVNGKPVNNVYVNGKPFFGDPKIATKNLTKDIIDKVQFVDSKTKAQAFSGKRGDQNNKTINLTIKKDKNRGWFGRVAGGIGTKKRYESAGLLNRFNDKQRISVLASANNINSSGFSFGEIQEMFGSFSNESYRGGHKISVNGLNLGVEKGLVISKTAGVTLADEFKKGMEINGNYFYSGRNSDDKEHSNREYILTNSHFFTSSNTVSKSDNHDHSAGIDFDIELDSTMLINLRPRFNFSSIDAFAKKNEITLNHLKNISNQTTNVSSLNSSKYKFDNELDFTKNIGNKGSYISFGIGTLADVLNEKQHNESAIKIYGNNPSSKIQNQKINSDTKLKQFSSFAEYRYPILSKKLFIDLAYDFKYRTEKDVTKTNDFNIVTNKYDSFNSLLSSDFIYNDISKTPSLGMEFENKKVNFRFISGYLNRTLSSQDYLRPQFDLERNFKAMTIESDFSYRWSRSKQLRVSYDLDNKIPNIRQIQAFEDVRNPSNIVVGNPNLKPTKSHKFRVIYRSFDFRKGAGFFFIARGNYDLDGIGYQTTISNQFIRKTSYTNVNGVYSFGGYTSYSHKFKLAPKQDIKVRIATSFGSDKTISIFNGIKTSTITNRLTPRLGLTFNYNENHSITTRYRIGIYATINELNEKQNRDFVRHNLQLKTRNNFNKLEFLNELRYNYNPNLIGFNKSSLFWNSSLSYYVIKDKGAITFKAYDILNQNLNAQRTATENYIEDKQSTVLQRYFMLGLSWKFNTLKGKKKRKRY